MSIVSGTLLVLGGLALADLVLASRWAARRTPRLARTAGGSVRGPLAGALVAAIRLYQAGWSGRNAGCCRFEPSCSAYALTAVRRYGGVRGGLLAARRLLRCQPFSPGGYDPVPGDPVPVDVPAGASVGTSAGAAAGAPADAPADAPVDNPAVPPAGARPGPRVQPVIQTQPDQPASPGRSALTTSPDPVDPIDPYPIDRSARLDDGTNRRGMNRLVDRWHAMASLRRRERPEIVGSRRETRV